MTVEKASDLHDIEMFGVSDPYVTLKVQHDDGNEIDKHTATVHNDMNPVFNECFTFELDETMLNEASKCFFEAEVHDEGSDGASMGRYNAPLANMSADGKMHLQTVPLLKRDGSPVVEQ